MSLGYFVSFDYLAKLRKLKKKIWGMGGGNEEKGYSYMKCIIKGYRREKKVGLHWSRQSTHRWRQSYQPYAPVALYSPETLFVCIYTETVCSVVCKLVRTSVPQTTL
jgi:hypothetical protein